MPIPRIHASFILITHITYIQYQHIPDHPKHYHHHQPTPVPPAVIDTYTLYSHIMHSYTSPACINRVRLQ